MNKPWFAEYPAEIPTELNLIEKPLQSYLTEAATLYSSKVAIQFMGKEMTYTIVSLIVAIAAAIAINAVSRGFVPHPSVSDLYSRSSAVSDTVRVVRSSSRA